MRFIERVVKYILMLVPPFWLAFRAWMMKLLHRSEPELDLLNILVDPERAAVDVGANNGVYTYKLCGLTKTVIAVEPNPDFVRELSHLFGARIRLVHAAATDRNGTVELVVPSDAAYMGGGALGTVEKENPIYSERGQHFEVQAIRLDDLLTEDVGFIKIDVEGHEDYVLAGAEQTLRRCRPVLLIEAENRHRPEGIEKVIQHLERLGYVGLFLDRGVLRPIAAFDPKVHQSEAAIRNFLQTGSTLVPYCNNFIFLPLPPQGST